MRIGQRHGETNTGRKRRRNEDSWVSDAPLFAVADGMGGAQAGEVASSLAAATLREAGGASTRGEAGVVALIESANRRVHQRAVTDATASGMGTTMTLALFAPDGTIAIGHVGDSRGYLLRDGRLQQLTQDHSLVAELVRRGELSPAEAEAHPQRSVITRALGTDPDVDVDAFSVQAQPGDVYLLCSDGLTTMVDDTSIAAIVERNSHDLSAAGRALIDEANHRGGEDNITAVLFEVLEGDDVDQTAELEEPAPVTDDAVTLHPGDLAVPQAFIDDPTADTMIVSADEIRAALAAEHVDEPARAPFPVVRAVASALLIVALAALIFFLVTKGLTQ